MDDTQWFLKVAIKNSTRKISFISKTSTTTAFPSNISNIDNDLFDDGELFSSLSLLTLIILYGIVVFSGVFGNSTLLISLCAQSTTRVKNPLLLALCVADLLVTMVSAPLTIIGVLLRQSRTSSFSMANIGCKIFHYMQLFPVAASSLCLLMLSLDRYATVKHPRFTQLRQRKYLPSVLAFVAWAGASVLCLPFLLVYKVTIPLFTTTSAPSFNGHQLNITTFSPRDGSLISDKKLCISDYGSDEWHIVFILSYVGISFVVPCFGIIFNHLGVRRKLCALSLTARAQHGELPLPMPTILRRPTNMILVTGMTALNVQSSSHDEFLSPQRNSKRNSNGSESNQSGIIRLSSNRRFNGSSGSGINPSSNKKSLGGTEEESRNLMETRFRSGPPRTPRSIRRAQNQQMRARLPSPPCPPAELPLPQTSTLRSRRRLANILVAAGFIYMLCWLPHVCCLVIREFNINDGCSNTAKEFFLLLGFTHSAVSPILHWILNYNSLKQSACQPFAKLNSAQRFLRSHLRFTGQPAAPPSSTNEEGLGPFNPKFIKQRPQIYKPPASSHYLY